MKIPRDLVKARADFHVRGWLEKIRSSHAGFADLTVDFLLKSQKGHKALMNAEFIQIVITVEKEADGEKIAAALVARRLAGCVQISGPISSIYHWRGKIEKAREFVCTAKTRRDLYPEIEQLVLDLHPYEAPEILATPILQASPSYLDWLKSELAQ